MTMNDNAHMESFFHHFKTERLKGRDVETDVQLREIISEYM